MLKKAVITYCCSLFCVMAWANTPAQLRRICEVSADNHLFYTANSQPCAAYLKLFVWGRNGFSGPFIIVDSIDNLLTNSYIHSNASQTGATNWFYYIETRDSCGPDYSVYSDTVFVDRTPPEIVQIDSVSVNPSTNLMIIGWQSNKSEDFSYYKLYRVQSTNIAITPFNNDTLRIDNTLGIVSDSIRYALSSVDSCERETEFRFNRHVSMRLRATPDTCIRTVALNWTSYIGWNVRAFYIYKSINNDTFVLVDSTTSLTYTDTFSLGFDYRYFIRAFKDTSVSVSSSSHSIAFSSRFRAEPFNTYLASISFEKPNDENLVIRVFNPGDELKYYDIYGSEAEGSTFTKVTEIPYQGNFSIGTVPYNSRIKVYRIGAINACNFPFLSTNTSTYIELSGEGNNLINSFNWNTYFTWNTGVDYYLIYRGTGNNISQINFSVLDTVSRNDSLYIDEQVPKRIENTGMCYYVAAVQTSGDVNGTIEQALSNTICITGDLLVFTPNAFRPNGINKTFRPEGNYIDYETSSMEIYDRYGGLIINITNLTSGWDGRDTNGVYCRQGVYVYKGTIKSTNGKQQIFSGLVTLLD
jgi:gliding motility-associated-like protein